MPIVLLMISEYGSQTSDAVELAKIVLICHRTCQQNLAISVVGFSALNGLMIILPRGFICGIERATDSILKMFDIYFP